jgi:hypothetical protein
MEEGNQRFYLNRMLDPGTGKYDQEFTPRDWGSCVSGMINGEGVEEFLDFVEESVPLPEESRNYLFKKWKKEHVRSRAKRKRLIII